MKITFRSLIALSAVVAITAAVAVSYVPLADAIAFLSPLTDPSSVKLVVANAALLALQADRDVLVRKAKDKIDEVKDGLTDEQLRVIETDHNDLLRQIGELDVKIKAEQERAPAATPPSTASGFSAIQIRAIKARATAFGLTSDDALTVLADPNVRSIEGATDALQNISAARAPGRTQPQRADIIRDEGDTLRAAAQSAIVLRVNSDAFKAGSPEVEQARQFRGMSLLELGRAFVEQEFNIRLRGLNKRELANVLLGLERSAGMHSTSDFANVLANVANKRLRDAYDVQPSAWKKLGRKSNNPDFKEKSVVQLSAAPKFKEVKEGQEYSYGAMTDGAEKYALATFGKIIAITRQTIINDDLGAFDRVPQMLGTAASNLEQDMFWKVLLDNPTMADNTALFHADHGNLPAASAINEAGLTAAEKALRDQRGFAAKPADRDYLNLIARYLVVGNAKKVEGQKMLSAVTPNAASGVNTFQNALEQITEARIPGNKWFLFADPMQIDTIEYSYLEGEEGVYTEMRQGFEVDGVQIKARLDFAAKAIDYRGMVYNSGA